MTSTINALVLICRFDSDGNMLRFRIFHGTPRNLMLFQQTKNKSRALDETIKKDYVNGKLDYFNDIHFLLLSANSVEELLQIVEKNSKNYTQLKDHKLIDYIYHSNESFNPGKFLDEFLISKRKKG